MNNITFGDDDVGYYETVAGGAGAVSCYSLAYQSLFELSNALIMECQCLLKVCYFCKTLTI